MNDDEITQRKRKYTRIDFNVSVCYSFSSSEDQWNIDEEYEGITKDISAGGFLLNGQIPAMKWIPELLLNNVNVSVCLKLPNQNETVNALTKVIRIEPVNETKLQFQLGLKFLDLSDTNHRRLLNLVLQKQSS